MIFCLCIPLTTVQAQYRFDSWTTDNGLPQNSVRKMVQTSDGYIWLTTLDGLARFDGVRFTVFNKSNSKNLPSNRLINLYAEKDDTLWICTEDQGLIRYQTGEFQNFTTADGLPSNFVYVTRVDSDGNLLAFTRSEGAARFDGTRFITVASSSESHEYKSQTGFSGTFWELNKNFLISIKNGQKNVYELPENVTKNFYPEYDFALSVALFEDRDGVLWLTTNSEKTRSTSGKLFRFAGEKFEEIDASGMPPSQVFNIAQDRRGDLWLATTKEGACRFSQNRFTCYNAESGLADFVRDILTDREGNFWITTDSRGVFRLSEQVITSISTKQGLAEKNVYTIFEDKSGAIWIGSLSGLAKYADGKFTNYKNKLLAVDVQSIFEDADGRLWIGSFGGIGYFENGKFYDFMPNLGLKPGGADIFDIHRDRQGVLWFASNIGLFRYDGASATLLTTKDGLPENSVKVILENDDGSLWIATYGGIALFKDGKFTAYTEKEGLAGNHVRTLYKDETGTLWIGTYESGLSRFRDGKFTNFNVESGLSSNGVFQILEDSQKNFWISSNQGIYRVSRAELNEFADGKRSVVKSTLFGKSDGMLNAEANGGGQPAGLKTKDGRLWFPTQDGIAVVNPELVKVNPMPPPVVIENVRIDKKSEPFAIANGSDIVLQPGQENLEIDYTGLSFIKPEQIRFRYKLEGLDKDWTDAGERRTAYFSYLPPGNYTFRVSAANSDNVWNEQGASIKIVVYPAFYQTWWFVVLCVLAIALLIFWIYQRRLFAEKRKRAAQEDFSRRLIAAHEAERRRVAAELHDSLGQTLAMIKNRAVFAVQNSNDLEKAKEEFNQITDQSTYAINEVREISYNLRPYLLERLGLTKALKSLFNKTAENSGLKITANIENIDNLFTSEEEMSIYRIVQESLNNILKHAEADEVKINIKKTEQFLTVKIQDNGKGFETNGVVNSNKKEGFGLLGMAERIKILGGTHTIESVLGQGTNVIFKINIKNESEPSAVADG